MKVADIKAWRAAVESDLVNNILPFWTQIESDEGYLGALKNDCTPVKESPIGLIMVARLLWTYARAYRLHGLQTHLDMATRAYRYLIDRFEDRDFGGFYWLLDSDGQPLETKKQTYGQAFVVYGFSEYFRATGDVESLERARQLFELLEKRTLNADSGGYWEAYGRKWEPLDDVSLSDKDLNAPLTMNTHLHLMEAYANLLEAVRDPAVETGCVRVLQVIVDRIIVAEKNRFGLFYTTDWSRMDETVSPGHDIEGSWLLWETAEIIGDPALLEEVRPVVLAMAEHTLCVGVDADGGVFDEIAEGSMHGGIKTWWPQAEATIGFLNAYQLSGENRYLKASHSVWEYIVRKVIDHENGEWFCGRKADGCLMDTEKAGPWKSSYHNARMGFELMERLQSILEEEDAPCL